MYYWNINIKCLVTCTLLCLGNILFGQISLVEEELQLISDQLVERLNNKDFDGKVLVYDFTDIRNQPTKFGIYLVGIFKSHLVNSSGRFEVVDREAKEKSGSKINLPKWLEGIGEVIKDPAPGEDPEEANRRKQIGESIEVVADATSRAGRKAPKISLKNIDAVIKGTITSLGDHYALDISVTKIKGDALIATANGDISITDNLANLHQSPVPPAGTPVSFPGETPPYPPVTPPNTPYIFEKLHLKFELIECVESGRYIECKFKITSKGKDTEIHFTRDKIRFFNQNNGKEYQPVSLNISDITNPWNVTKALIRDTPVTSVITFQPGERVDVISRLEMACYSESTQWFVIDISDIFVQ